MRAALLTALLLLLAACATAPRMSVDPLTYDPADMRAAHSVVIGVPGALTSVALLKPLDQFAAPGRAVAYYRLPGLDGRPAGDRLNIDAAAAHIATFVARHEFDSVYLVGFSTGSAINLEATKRILGARPQTRVFAAAISSALPAPQPVLAGWRGFRGNLAAAARTGSLDRRTIWLEYYKTLLYGRDVTRDADKQSAAQQIADANAARITLPDSQLARSHTFSLTGWTNPDPGRLAGATLGFFHGADDPVFPLPALRRFAGRLPGDPLTVVYPDQGHLLLITRPQVFADIYQFFGLHLH